jgi:hypothetical protein
MNSTASPANLMPAAARPETKPRPAFGPRKAAPVALNLDGEAHGVQSQAHRLRDEWRKRRYSRLKP